MSQANSYEEIIKRFVHQMQDAEAIVIGAGSGMSAADGYVHYYKRDDVFAQWFGDFEEKYGFHNSFNGVYYRYRTREEYWAFMARMIKLIRSSKAGQSYQDLKKLLEGRNYHVLTTNQDTLFTQICPEEKISAIQGDWRYNQCKNRCHDAIYENGEQVDRMVEAIDDCAIPTALLPRCPKCGGKMEPWIRSYDFLEGRKYREEYEKLDQFLRKNQQKKVLFLELGVGRMTPVFIQEPFWQLTYAWENAFYTTINPKDARMPKELEKKGLVIQEDIARVLHDAVALQNEM